MKNPCKSCDNLHGDKNRSECKGCRDRIRYIASLGGNAYDERPDTVKPAAVEPICTVPGCGEKHLARGLCRSHYDRQYNKAARSAPKAKKAKTSPAKTNIEHKGEFLMKEESESIPMAIDMSRIPGAEEILKKIREIGQSEMRPMEYQAAKILQDAIIRLEGRIQ